jgi:hypothetical protein
MGFVIRTLGPPCLGRPSQKKALITAACLPVEKRCRDKTSRALSKYVAFLSGNVSSNPLIADNWR